MFYLGEKIRIVKEKKNKAVSKDLRPSCLPAGEVSPANIISLGGVFITKTNFCNKNTSQKENYLAAHHDGLRSVWKEL